MNVYLVELDEGEDGAARVEAVFSTPDLAEEYVAEQVCAKADARAEWAATVKFVAGSYEAYLRQQYQVLEFTLDAPAWIGRAVDRAAPPPGGE